MNQLTIIPAEDNPYNLEIQEYLFVEEFLTTFDGTKAARALGLPSPATSAKRLLKKPSILLAIRDALDTRVMGTEEVLLRLSQIARADLADFASITEFSDLSNLRDKGIHTHVIKRFKKFTKTYKNGDVEETTEIELHDPLRSIQMIGKFHRMFDDYVKQLNIDLDNLSEDQLRRLAEGEDLIKVLMLPEGDNAD